MELFARLSCVFTAGDVKIENDDYINEELNSKLKSFIKSKDINEYRIINAETSILPGAAVGPGYEGVQISLFIAYKAGER